MLYESAEEQVKENKRENTECIRLATVTSINSDGRARVTFYGESTEATKLYSYVDSYTPTLNDVVALIKQGNTYIILGAVKAGEVVQKYALSDHTHSGYASEYHTHNKIANDGETRGIELNGAAIEPIGNTDLGSTDSPYGYVYATNLYVGGDSISSYCNKIGIKGNPYIYISNGSLQSSSTAYHDIGTSSNRFNNGHFNNLYVGGHSVTTSDKRKKKTIKDITKKYVDFFKKLRPVTFKYRDGKSDRLHTGFIAQEVEQAMIDSNLTDKEFAGLVIQENGDYGLRYEEFISIQTKVIQDLLKRVEELERKVQK